MNNEQEQHPPYFLSRNLDSYMLICRANSECVAQITIEAKDNYIVNKDRAEFILNVVNSYDKLTKDREQLLTVLEVIRDSITVYHQPDASPDKAFCISRDANKRIQEVIKAVERKNNEI